MSRAPTMHVEWWKNVEYFEGGCWALMLDNRLFAEPMQKGRHELTRRRLEKLATLWNEQAEIERIR